MTHARTQVIDALVALVTDLDTTAARVLKTHSQRLIVDPAECPCLLVYRAPGQSEISEHDADDKLARQCRVVVKGVVREAADSEVLLDQIAVEVEEAVTRTLGGLAIDCIPVETNFIFNQAHADAEIAAIEITFVVLYRTVIGAPETSV